MQSYKNWILYIRGMDLALNNTFLNRFLQRFKRDINVCLNLLNAYIICREESCEVSLSWQHWHNKLIMRCQHKAFSFLFFFSFINWLESGFVNSSSCSSVLGCFTSSYRRDLCKLNWHIVKYLLHIVYKSILFWAILLHLILWQSMHFMKAFVCFYYYYTQWTANAQVACICNKP